MLMAANPGDLSIVTDDFPATIQHLPILTEAKTKFTTSADVDRQVTEALSQGTSLYELDVEQLHALKPTVIVTQVSDACPIALGCFSALHIKL